MTNTASTQQKFNLVKYVYGRIYAAYIEQGRPQVWTLEDIKTRNWVGVLCWLKKTNHIADFKFGQTLQDGFKVTFSRFNENDLMYGYYLKAIERNIVKNRLDVTGQEIAELNQKQQDDFDKHIEEVRNQTNVERVSREDSTTAELNKQVQDDLNAQ